MLLPDAVYSWAGDPVTEIAAKAAGSGFAFGAVKASPGEIAAAEALSVRDRVQAYADRPAAPAGYDALGGARRSPEARSAWTGCGLSPRPRPGRAGPVTHPSLRLSPVTWLGGLTDCGTWDAYLAELRGPEGRQR